MAADPWTADLDRLRSDLEPKIECTSVDLRQEIARSAAETRRHFDVVMEHLGSKVQVVAEGVAMVDEKVDRLRDEMEQRFDQVDRRLLCLSSHGFRAPDVMSDLLVQDAGPLTTIQDLGRPGHLRVGIPASGPMDREAFLLANRLIANPDTAAGLECTLIGPRLEFTDERLIAITGADMAPTVNGAPVAAWQGLRVHAGDVLKLGPARTGVRAYLAIAGGIQTPPVLGSRSTYVRGRLGGLEGRALRKADRLPLGPVGAARPRRLHPDHVPAYASDPELAVVLGPQDDRFTPKGIAALFEAPYEMLPQNDRMGARLRGAFIEHTRGHDIISDGVALGGIQVIGDGQPIVLLADRQSTGGYTKIGTICSFHIGRIAQVKPGGRLHFRRVTVAEAHAMLRQSLRALDTAIE